ncbi:ABC transporter permease [Pseudogracilibacillus auburnensis]|uniref:Transport permease protein n=1 Tax=Pseudogracilibacillus auburnensis TaxID=1494959 RepID=A0A2V3WBR1_9BACI|nr:ABC transporter permease [Pseudogracilibacillus auburnensis]MBO1001213.1 ABC transporter permease [Pseudogracilibacillus auburnensis]PXW90648.1 ABC-2 type transport system permease protein [Pseudogracilibacillus auburnensis]
MNKPKTSIFFDSWIMFKRCLLISLRNPEALLMATITPFFLMFLFGTVFGNIADVGDLNYIDFIVPGIIMQSLGQASQHSAINVATDMTKGIIDRFRSMSISKYAVLIGHTGAGGVRNTISTTVIIGSAFILGFRPQGGFVDWLIVVGLLMLVNIAISLIAVLCGLISKTPEGSSGLMFPLFILPFLSSGFAPTDTMSSGIRWFAEIQPMTPIINSIRALMLDLPLGNSLWIALAWSVGIIIVAFTASTQVYNRKLS